MNIKYPKKITLYDNLPSRFWYESGEEINIVIHINLYL